MNYQLRSSFKMIPMKFGLTEILIFFKINKEYLLPRHPYRSHITYLKTFNYNSKIKHHVHLSMLQTYPTTFMLEH